MERSQKPLVNIKGIYATALTGVLLDRDFRITRPSPEIRQRFQLKIVDEDVLEQKRKSAQLASALVEKALDEAREIHERLTGRS